MHVDNVEGLNDMTEKIQEDICDEVDELVKKEDKKKEELEKAKNRKNPTSFEPEITTEEGDSEIYVQIEGPRRLTVPLNAEINIICNAYVNLKVSKNNKKKTE